MDKSNDAERVVSAFQKAMNQDPESSVVIHAVWADTPHSACVLYERNPSKLGLIGRRIVFPPHAIAGDPESTGNDWAQNVREPLGRLVSYLRKDERGISWIGIRGDTFPLPPIGGPEQVKS
ncbi:hypothetical protein ACQCSX_22800 (plasmid) [Pseudarthrobacter sp. P1]|uniref:hypothetical protein n=1 Tax=Pseudarthrobacter sp. P1 TaxID=3418418 RepID=UPI003CF14D0D